MNWLKFKLKKICTVYKVTDSYHFNDKHNSDSYLNSIVQILTVYDLINGVNLSAFSLCNNNFEASFERKNSSGVNIECVIEFDTTTLTIIVIE